MFIKNKKLRNDCKKLLTNNISVIILSVLIGILLGEIVNETVVSSVILIIKQITGQIIFFLVPLIVFGFVASSITNLKSDVTRLLLFAFLIAYLSSEMAALFSMSMSRIVVPYLEIVPIDDIRQLPNPLFLLEIPPLMSVMSALLFAVLTGLGTVWTQSRLLSHALRDFQALILLLVNKVLMPLLPLYIAMNFCLMSYQGQIGRFVVFLPVLLIVVLAHYAWLAILYSICSLYSGINGWKVLRNYGKAYLTALGTMSSAATLATAIECANKSKVIRKEVVDFSIPLFANIHLSGAMITEVFFLSVVSMLLYGHLPSIVSLVLFILLLGVFAVGAPGVPAGTAFASIGIITSVLGFDDNGIALFLAIFALQDSFGTGCNIVGDGALTMAVQSYKQRITD